MTIPGGGWPVGTRGKAVGSGSTNGSGPDQTHGPCPETAFRTVRYGQTAPRRTLLSTSKKKRPGGWKAGEGGEKGWRGKGGGSTSIQFCPNRISRWTGGVIAREVNGWKMNRSVHRHRAPVLVPLDVKPAGQSLDLLLLEREEVLDMGSFEGEGSAKAGRVGGSDESAPPLEAFLRPSQGAWWQRHEILAAAVSRGCVPGASLISDTSATATRRGYG